MAYLCYIAYLTRILNVDLARGDPHSQELLVVSDQIWSACDVSEGLEGDSDR